MAVLCLGAFGVARLLRKPELLRLSPLRARVGEAIQLSGKNFSDVPGDDVVLVGGSRANVRSASAESLVAEVPEVPATAGHDMTLPVSVRVGSRETQALSLAVYSPPRIHGLSPDVAMPGEEVTLAGSGWAANAVVRFGATAAEVIENTPEAVRVRVPAIDGPPGTPAPVTIADGMDASNPAPFLIGRLPLILSAEPREAPPGTVVTLTGRGFRWKASENIVRVAGVRAFVASVQGEEMKIVVPWVPGSGGTSPLELQVPEVENKGTASLEIPAPSDPVDFKFAVEPVDVSPPCNCAAVSTPLGPAFVLAASGNRTAADRAMEAARRLNDAAIPLKASRDLNFEVRNLETRPILALAGRPETIVEVTSEDAQAYNEDWTRLGGKGGAVSPARLALWWQAIARDLVLLLVRGERPTNAAGLAPEGRVFGEVFEASRKTGRFGVPREVMAALRAPTLSALRTVGLRVPAQIAAPAGAAPAAQVPVPAGAASAVPPLHLDGEWFGTTLEAGQRRGISAQFQGRTGSLSFDGGVSISLPLFGVEQPQKDALRFGVEYRGSAHYFSGRWDGRKIAGRISADRSDRGDLGAFELTPR